jgi:hypothetical protein
MLLTCLLRTPRCHGGEQLRATACRQWWAMTEPERIGLVLAGGRPRRVRGRRAVRARTGAGPAGPAPVDVPRHQRGGDQLRLLRGQPPPGRGGPPAGSKPGGRWLADGWCVRCCSGRCRARRCATSGRCFPSPAPRAASLLDPVPLERNLERWIDLAQAHRRAAGGVVDALAVVATAVRSGRTEVFVERGGTAPHRSHVLDYIRGGSSSRTFGPRRRSRSSSRRSGSRPRRRCAAGTSTAAPG